MSRRIEITASEVQLYSKTDEALKTKRGLYLKCTVNNLQEILPVFIKQEHSSGATQTAILEVGSEDEAVKIRMFAPAEGFDDFVGHVRLPEDKEIKIGSEENCVIYQAKGESLGCLQLSIKVLEPEVKDTKMTYKPVNISGDPSKQVGLKKETQSNFLIAHFLVCAFLTFAFVARPTADRGLHPDQGSEAPLLNLLTVSQVFMLCLASLAGLTTYFLVNAGKAK